MLRPPGVLLQFFRRRRRHPDLADAVVEREASAQLLLVPLDMILTVDAHAQYVIVLGAVAPLEVDARPEAPRGFVNPTFADAAHDFPHPGLAVGRRGPRALFKRGVDVAVLGAAVEVARLVYDQFRVGAVGAAGQLHQVAHEVRVQLREEGHFFCV